MKMLPYLLTSAALLAAFTAPALANDREMPKHLAGQWCQTSGTNNQGDYTKAKVACKARRCSRRPPHLHWHPSSGSEAGHSSDPHQLRLGRCTRHLRACNGLLHQLGHFRE
jgi:hypothetical protein